MKPDLDELDEEIRGHLALSIRERIERGEDPESARLAALKEFGNVLLTRDSIRRVWRHRWLDDVEALARDIRFALRSLVRAKTLTVTVGGRATGHARGDSHRSPGAGAIERVRVLGAWRHRPAHCHCRRRWRPGILGEQAHA
jgi:hypothetical protein